MALDLTADDVLSLSSLVTVDLDLEPYVLEWPAVPDTDGALEAVVLVVMKRQGGLLLAVPPLFIPASILERGNAGQDAGSIGASTSLVVPGVIVENGIRSSTGSLLEVLVVDVAADLVSQMRATNLAEDIAMAFDPESPFTLPSPVELLQGARDWIRGAGEETGLNFYSAEGQSETEIDEAIRSPRAAAPKRSRRLPKAGATPTGGGGPSGRPKKLTTADLAMSLDQLLQVVPRLSDQLQDLSQRQVQLENRIVAPSRAGALGLAQPLSSTITPHVAGASSVADVVSAPPSKDKESWGPWFIECAKLSATGLACFGGGEGFARSSGWGLGEGSICPVPSFDSACGADSPFKSGPLGGFGGFFSEHGYQGRFGASSPPNRASLPFGPVLCGSDEGNGTKDAADSVCYGFIGRASSEGHQWNALHGTFRRLRKAPGSGIDSFPGDGSHGLPAGGKSGSCQGHSGFVGSLHRSGGVGRRQIRSGGSLDVAGGPSLFDLCEPPPGSPEPIQILHSLSGSTLGDSGSRLCERIGPDQFQEARTHQSGPKSFKPAGGSAQGKAFSQEEGERSRSRRRASATGRSRGGMRQRQKSAAESKSAVPSVEGQESNPLRSSISFNTWAICLPRWIARSKTKFAWHLRRSFCFSTRQSMTLSTTAFPLPLPQLPSCIGKGYARLSRRRLVKLCRARLLHVTIFTLNYLYLGRFPTLDELGRKPSCSQEKIISNLRASLAVCGSSNELFSLAPGRSGPELGACLYQLERFFAGCPELQNSYLDKPIGFSENQALFPNEEYPELTPYRALDADRLRLVGEGRWPMSDFLEGSLWLPFVEPAVLQHGLDVDETCAPNFAHESRHECFKLMKVWDSRGLLELFDGPSDDGLFSRVFNCFKGPTVDRQIGDRRRVNSFSHQGLS